MVSPDVRGAFTNIFPFLFFPHKAITVTHDWLNDLCWIFSEVAPTWKVPPFVKNDHFIRTGAMLRLSKFLYQFGFAK